MSRSQAVNAIAQIFGIAERTGATIPKPLRDQHEALTVLADRVRDMQRGDNTPSVSDAVLDALAADVEPGTDETVRNAVVSRTVAEHANGVDEALGARAGSFLRDNADAILGAFVKPFDQAAASISAALEQLGDADLDDTASVLRLGGDSARLWAAVQDAERTIALIRTTRELLSAADSAFAVDRRYKLLTYAAVPPAVFLDDQLGGSELAGWQVVRRGWPLSLATPSELGERVDAVGAELTARQHAGERAFQGAVQRRYGFRGSAA